MSSAGSKKWCCSEAEKFSEYDCAPPSEIPCLVSPEITSESLPWSANCFPSGFLFSVSLHFQDKYHVHGWKKGDGLWYFTNTVIPWARGETQALTVQIPSQALCLQSYAFNPWALFAPVGKKPCRRPLGGLCLPWLVWRRWPSDKSIDRCWSVWDGYHSLTPHNVRGGLHLARVLWKQMGVR